jgi:hypothetical protein
MARVKNNATDRMSGKVDQFVYRDCNGKTIAAKKPGKSKKPPTANQENARKKFRRASRYGTSVSNDPVLRVAYENRLKPDLTIYNLAVADYYDAPAIDLVKLEGYMGHIGDKIAAAVDDRFVVAWVKVSITRADGSLVEQGNAVLGPDGTQWFYHCTVENTNLVGCVVTITASDLPGNITTEQKTL